MNLSVVLPAKNEEGVIDRCLERLVPQIDPGDEVLVLDNGSEDATADVAAEFDHVTVIDAPDERVEETSHYRGNLDGVRNFGTKQATNEIVVSTDADTLPPPGWLDRIREHFESDPDLDLVWGVPEDINGVPLRNMESKFANLFGAVSGCNTAFRKSTFEELQRGYVGWPFYEDAAIVNRIARVGKVVHDRDLAMPTDMERRRFQTIPIMVGSTGGVVMGGLLGGSAGAALAGTSVGMAGTELLYEEAPATRFHHDQVGLLLILGGVVVGGTAGLLSAGVGSGIVAHHVLTEGISAIPTDLEENTDLVCAVPELEGDEAAMIECEPAEPTTAAVTRMLAAVTVGAVAGRVMASAI